MMLRAGSCVVLTLASLLASCAQDTPASEKELSGYVTDRLSGRGIRGASVRFTSDTLYTESTRTDDDGYYEMVIETDTPLGQVRAEHGSYQPGEATVFFDTRERAIDIELLPLPSE